jgi:hypothetical protein
MTIAHMCDVHVLKALWQASVVDRFMTARIIMV